MDCSLKLLIKEVELNGLVNLPPSPSAGPDFSSVGYLGRMRGWLPFSQWPAEVLFPLGAGSRVHSGTHESVCVSEEPLGPRLQGTKASEMRRAADVELSEGSECQLDIEHGRRRVEFPKQMKDE